MLAEQLFTERFQPVIGNGGGDGSGGTVHFRVSDCKAECDSGVSILVGGEEAGAKLAFGCRMGICHTCVGRLQDGAVRDIRTGAVEQASGQMIRICINAPEGARRDRPLERRSQPDLQKEIACRRPTFSPTTRTTRSTS